MAQPADGLQRLMLLVDEAERFHNTRGAGSKRSSRSRRLHKSTDLSLSVDSGSSQSTLGSGGGLPPAAPTDLSVQPDQWQLLRSHIDEFWRVDPATPEKKYQLAKRWLVPMRLWDPEVSWEECRSATGAVFGTQQATKHLARLQALPPGQLFFA
jgi:hypothetical protein